MFRLHFFFGSHLYNTFSLQLFIAERWCTVFTVVCSCWCLLGIIFLSYLVAILCKVSWIIVPEKGKKKVLVTDIGLTGNRGFFFFFLLFLLWLLLLFLWSICAEGIWCQFSTRLWTQKEKITFIYLDQWGEKRFLNKIVSNKHTFLQFNCCYFSGEKEKLFCRNLIICSAADQTTALNQYFLNL